MIAREGTRAARMNVAQPCRTPWSLSPSRPARSRSLSQRRLILRGSAGVPMVEANTSPSSRHALSVLLLALLAQVPYRELGQDDCPPGCARLRLNDPQLAARVARPGVPEVAESSGRHPPSARRAAYRGAARSSAPA